MTSKVCSKCLCPKDISEFYKAKGCKLGVQSWCKICDNYRKTLLSRKKSIEAGKKQRTLTLDMKALLVAGLKRCPKCKQEKLLDEFSKSKNKKHAGKRATYCKECVKVGRLPYSKEQYQRRKDKQRNAKLQKKYGLTLEDYKQLETLQKGVCAICGGTDNDKCLAVDHDHKTGKVRALLCGCCNPAVGFVRTVGIAKKIVEYLEKYSEPN